MSNSKRKSGRGLLYGEESVQVNVRVPKSKKEEILDKFYLVLRTYEKASSVVIDNGIPKWKIEAEKKSNPADYDSVKQSEEIKSILSDEAGKFPLKVPIEKIGEKESDVIGVSKLATTNNSAKKVDMEALGKIASGEGLKGEFSLTKKKVDFDQEYDFEYVKSIPGINDAIYVDKKGLACYDKDDLGVFYVKWDGKYMRFEDKSEFDRFAKEYLILI
jgi:hypothetical protein